MKHTRTFFTSVTNNLIALFLFLAIWTVLSFIDAGDIAGPRESLGYFFHEGNLNNFLFDLGQSLERTFLGFIIAFILGTGIGLIAYLFKSSETINSLLILFHISPGLIIGIIFLGIFGISSMVPIALILFMVTPLVAINTSNALHKKNQLIEDYIISMGGGYYNLFIDSWLPALAGAIKSNSTIGFGLALKVVILGEFLGCMNGIGYRLNVAYIYMNLHEVFFYLFVILLIMLTYQILFSAFFASILNRPQSAD